MSDKPGNLTLVRGAHSHATSKTILELSRLKLVDVDKHPNCVFKVIKGSVDVELEVANQFQTIDRLEEGDYFRLHPPATQSLGYRIRYRIGSESATVQAIPAPDILASVRMLKEVVLSTAQQSLVLQGIIAKGSLPRDEAAHRADKAFLESLQEELEVQIQENAALTKRITSLHGQMTRMDREHADWKALRDRALEHHKEHAQKATDVAAAALRVMEEARKRQTELEQFAKRVQRGLEIVSCDNPKMHIRPAALYLLLGEEPPMPDNDDVEALSERFLRVTDDTPSETTMDDSWDLESMPSGSFEIVTASDLVPIEPEPPSPAPKRRQTPPPLPKVPRPAPSTLFNPRQTAQMVSSESTPSQRLGINVPPGVTREALFDGNTTASIGIPYEVRNIKPLSHDKHVADVTDEPFEGLRDSWIDEPDNDFKK